MKISIKYRLFLAFLAATVTLVACMFMVTKFSFDRGFLRYIDTVEQQRIEKLASELQRSYADHGSWDFLRRNQRAWINFLIATLADEKPERPTFTEPPDPAYGFSEGNAFPARPPVPLGHHFEFRVLLLNADRQTIFGPGHYPQDLRLRTLKHQDRTVGYLAVVPPRGPREIIDPQQRIFAEKQRRSFAFIALAMATAFALLSIPLSRRLVRRITKLAAATHLLTAGKYDTRVPAGTSDELDQLAQDFNSLAQTLEKNQQLRRQWVADISHELRTPLAVLRGEIEALQDGVRPQSAQSLKMLHDEVMHLNHLVEDLYQLSLADINALSYRKESTDLIETLRQAVEPFRDEFNKCGIVLDDDKVTTQALYILGDKRRLHQLFNNLLENSLRYTESGGKLRIQVENNSNHITIHLEDTAPGVPPDKMSHLFDRLFRVEGSRSRSTGGAGLGLALCKTIVEAHNGTIIARPSTLGGLWVKIVLPSIGTRP